MSMGVIRRRGASDRSWGVQAALVAGLLFTACSSASTGSAGVSKMPADTMVRPSLSAEPTEDSTGPEPGETFASPPAESIPAGARVPNVRGDEFEDAVASLRTLGMDFGTVVARPSRAGLWVVVDQDPGPGEHPLEDRQVALVVSSGRGGRNMACEPERDDIDEPYCLGHLLQYY
jgi:PASTA domain-containing protein